jgi:beta-glucosidase/6-phospho-beta-glucosidase/beta-galactosidase
MSHPFMFATGIENSIPTIRAPDGKTVRIDQMELCGHYRRWRDDLNLVKELGIEYLRYGPPYYKTHLGPGRYDWSFADETFARMRELHITPLVDLCHFGVPDWIGSFQNPDWPRHFADYAAAFAARFPWVRFYTPVNEIFIAATFSALYGWWNERLTSDRSFVTALKHLCSANVRAMHAIKAQTHNALFIQSESTEYFHALEPASMAHADMLNARRFLSLDLIYGHGVSATMYQYLTDNGMSREEYHWFQSHALRDSCIMGNDYYLTNEHLVHADGSTEASGEIFGYYVITRQYYDRYRLPVMHTETNLVEENDAVRWLNKEWANMRRLQEDGVPILGFTWYSLTDQMDWDTALREQNGRVSKVGLFDLDRNIRPVGKAYGKLIWMWRETMPTSLLGLQLT